MFVMEIKLNHNLEITQIKNTQMFFQHTNIIRSTRVIRAFQYNPKYYLKTSYLGENLTIYYKRIQDRRK